MKKKHIELSDGTVFKPRKNGKWTMRIAPGTDQEEIVRGHFKRLKQEDKA